MRKVYYFNSGDSSKVSLSKSLAFRLAKRDLFRAFGVPDAQTEGPE